RPRRFRPEPPSTLLARLADRQGAAFDQLGQALEQLTAPETATLVELHSSRGAVQVMGHEIARAERRVAVLAPPDGCLALAPHLRRAAATVEVLQVFSAAAVPIAGLEISIVGSSTETWPGEPVLMVVDDRAALIGARNGERFSGHFGSGAAFIAAARLVLASFHGEN